MRGLWLLWQRYQPVPSGLWDASHQVPWTSVHLGSAGGTDPPSQKFRVGAPDVKGLSSGRALCPGHPVPERIPRVPVAVWCECLDLYTGGLLSPWCFAGIELVNTETSSVLIFGAAGKNVMVSQTLVIFVILIVAQSM